MAFLKAFKMAPEKGMTRNEGLQMPYEIAYGGLEWHPYNDACALGTDVSYPSTINLLNLEQYESLQADFHLNFQYLHDQLVAKLEQHFQQMENKYDQMMNEFKSHFEILSKHVNNVADYNANSLKLQFVQEHELLKQELGRVIKVQIINSTSDPLLMGVSTQHEMSSNAQKTQHKVSSNAQKVTLQSSKDSDLGMPKTVSKVIVKHGDHLPRGCKVPLQQQHVSDFVKPDNITGEVIDQKSQQESALEVMHKHQSMPDFENPDNVASTMMDHKSKLMSAFGEKYHQQSVSGLNQPNNVTSKLTDHKSHLVSAQEVIHQYQSLSGTERPDNVARATINHKRQSVSEPEVTWQKQNAPGFTKPHNAASATINHDNWLISTQEVKRQHQSVSGLTKPINVASKMINNQIINFQVQNSEKNVDLSQVQEQRQTPEAYLQRQTGGKQDTALLTNVQGVASLGKQTDSTENVKVRSYANVVTAAMTASKDNLTDESEFSKVSCSTALDIPTPRKSSMTVLGTGTYKATGRCAEIIANQMKRLEISHASL